MRIGDFELHPSERTLLAGGRPVELGARAFDLLLVLAEHAGRLVPKATLIERVWPKVIVDENNLPAQIATLRRVLGAAAIRTVPGFGYRLELDIRPAPEAGAAALPPADLPSRAADGLAPPPRAWPERLAPLVGREDDVAQLEQLLERGSIATIVGEAGVGKTRLAQELYGRACHASRRSVGWVALGTLDDPAHVPSAIALALGVPLPRHADGFAALGPALDQRSTLVVLDGAEHLADALAAPLELLISRIPGLSVLVTSQAPLGIRGETVYRLASLAVPGEGTAAAAAAGYGAVALFTQRAVAADRRFELSDSNTATIVEICRRLDGNPLALELAAARVPSLGLAALLGRLDDRFRLLKLSNRPTDSRHGALHTAFDWSYGLLGPAEQRLFNRLGAFAGSFSLTAAARAAADAATDTTEAIDILGRLVDRSLVSALPLDPPRYALLETARCYALDKLAAAGELDTARRRMAGAVLEILDASYDEYWALDEAIWLARYAPDLENVRAAMDFALAHDRELGVALYGSAWPLLVEADLHAEGRQRYERMVGLLSDALPRARVGRFWEAIASYDSTRHCDRARFAAELSATMHAGDGGERSRYYALMQLAFNWRADNEAARDAFDAARALEDPTWPARLLAHGAMTEGAVLTTRGEFAAARTAYRRALRLALSVSERQALAATADIVELDVACGDFDGALQLGRPLAERLRHSSWTSARYGILVTTFSALLLAGKLEEARAIGVELVGVATRHDLGKLYTALDAMAFLAAREGRCEAAARIAHLADCAYLAHGQPQRRPTESRLRQATAEDLDRHGAGDWRTVPPAAARDRFDETAACALALGLTG